MKIALVGSSIHGNLLKPNDQDVAIETSSLKEFLTLSKFFSAKRSVSNILKKDDKAIATAKHDTLNIILLLNISIKEYTDGMDLNIVRGFIDGSNGKLYLNKDAQESLQSKILKFLPRSEIHEKLFKEYDETDRKVKYVSKVPVGFKLVIEG